MNLIIEQHDAQFLIDMLAEHTVDAKGKDIARAFRILTQLKPVPEPPKPAVAPPPA